MAHGERPTVYSAATGEIDVIPPDEPAVQEQSSNNTLSTEILPPENRALCLSETHT